ncbi:preprotein translocase subunit SecE [Microtetraspora sp. NBRC 13810]|uniref:preprotein translocase subunit SecE n=1 Tax=Microtetraspora sp. NBRC 13810 TaxID=3030990 RepID=UPI002552C8F2|nr:preprotein translocase subunit SecE [Microtetraspora sp. NBRC 13810]
MAIDTRGETSDTPSRGKKRTTPALFYRQVVAELRKVIWPTRKDLITYTTVVLVFVLIMVAIVTALDFVLTEGVLVIFGGS